VRGKRIEAATLAGATTHEYEAQARDAFFEEYAKKLAAKGKRWAAPVWFYSEKVEHFLSPYHLIYHVPNGGYRAKATARGLQYQGVEKGVADVPIDVPWKPGPAADASQVIHGLRLEFKRTKGGRLSPEQALWRRRWTWMNYLWREVKGCQAAIEITEGYFNGLLKEQGGHL